MRRSHTELVKLFEMLDLADAEGIAGSQINEGFDQANRYLFLRQAWKAVLSEQESIDALNGPSRFEFFYNKLGPEAAAAFTDLMGRGAKAEGIVDLVRSIQIAVLWDVCNVIDEPALDEFGLDDPGWGLFEIDEFSKPNRRIDALHESVPETDPTGRETVSAGAKNFLEKCY